MEFGTFWDWYWLIATLVVVIVLFGIPELVAIHDKRPGDTYSEWWWRNILWPQPAHPLYRYRRIGRILFISLLVILAIHGLSEGRVI